MFFSVQIVLQFFSNFIFTFKKKIRLDDFVKKLSLKRLGIECERVTVVGGEWVKYT